MSTNTLAPTPPPCPDPLTCTQSCGNIRRAIVKLARQLCDAGAHYLWGSTGDTPTGTLTGASYRPHATGTATPYKNPNVSWRDEAAWRKDQRDAWQAKNPGVALPKNFPYPYFAPNNTLAICAGTCGVAGYHVCSGRCDNSHVSGAKIVSATDADLLAYLQKLGGPKDKTTQDTPPTTPPKLTPRMITGLSEIPGLSQGDLRGKIVWGEDCTNARHFDCIGFVNYCYIANAAGFVQAAIEQWSGLGTKATKLCKPSDPPWPADVLVKSGNHHIGICDGGMPPEGVEASYMPNVVQALCSSAGVTSDERHAEGKWGFRVRVPCENLKPSGG